MRPEIAPPRIAIIGTEASGKTVLITVLAKRYSHVDAEGLFLNPLDNATLKFVERTYQILAAGDWPASSPVGQLFKLRWRLQVKRDPHCNCEIRLVDSAGQDLRRIFGNDQDIRSLPEHLRDLADYCRSADIVICLINLKDFVGEKDPLRRMDTEAVIKSALEFLIADESRTRHLCVLFTQADQFIHERDRYGGWSNVASKYLPYVNGAFLHDRKATVGAVAAVKDTQVVELDGAPRRVPAPGFSSDGLDQLMNWVAAQIDEVVAARSADAQRIEAARQQREQQRMRQENEERRRRAVRDRWKKFGWAAAVLIPLWLFLATAPPKPQSFRLTVSAATAQGEIEPGFLWDDFRLKNTSNHSIYDVQVDVDLSNSPRNGKIYSLNCPKIGAGEDHVWKNFVDVPKGTNFKMTLKAKWFMATAGIDFGRNWDDVWMRNDSSIPAKNVLIEITTNGQQPPLRLSVPSLAPGEIHTWPNAVSVSGSDRVQCVLLSFDDN